MKAPRYEVAEVLNQGWHSIESKEIKLNSWQVRTLRAIKDCRTSALGGHIDGCSSCGYLQLSYNSCRNRHCPKCQGHKKQEWIEARNKDLLPVQYFHVVFTIPHELNCFAVRNKKIFFNILFKAASETILELSKDKKWVNAETGFTTVLHTWGQLMTEHPHLHCISSLHTLPTHQTDPFV